MNLYQKTANWLAPKQPIVTAFLLLIIAVSVYFLCSKNTVARTLWAAIVLV